MLVKAIGGGFLGCGGQHKLDVERFDWWRQGKSMQGRWNSLYKTWAGEGIWSEESEALEAAGSGRGVRNRKYV